MDPFILLVVGAVGLAGCVILLLLGLNMLREERGGKESAAETSAPHGAGAPAGSAAMAPALEAGKPDAARPAGGGVGGAFAGVTARFSGNAARGNAHEVLRVLRDNLTGRLSLEIAGKRYPSLDDVRDDEVRQALMTTLQDLEAFAGGALSGAAAEPSTEAAPSASAIVRSVAASRAARPAPAGEAAAAPAAEYKPLPPPSMNPFKQMAVLREIAKNPPPEPKSITEQIDDVLQERIIGTPLIHRNLHVRPGPRGDALFEADGQSYASVDELPDVEVRDAIKAAIVEWEKSR